MELNPKTIEQLRERGKKSLFFFARVILGFRDIDPIVHQPITQMVQDYKNNTRCIVVIPRTWFKSSVVTIAYSLWRVINDPNVRGLIAQNTYDNACKKLKAISGIVEKNHLFRALYPEILPTSGCRWTNECLEFERTAAHPEGSLEAAGVGTMVTARHYDFIIEDDTVAAKKDDMTGVTQQPTQMDIEKAIGWHSLAHPLLLHPVRSQIVIVGTRWAEVDVIGYVRENFPEYKVVERAIAEDKDGKAATLEEGGKLTWPERFNEDAYRELESSLGPYMFSCLYLNKPTSAINQIFRRNWIMYFENKPKECFACTSVDLASAEKSETSDPDYNVVLTTAIEPKSGRIYIIDYTRRRMSPSEVVDVIFSHYQKHKFMKVIVEAIGYQRTFIHWLQRRQQKTDTMFYVEALKSLKGSKADRILGLQPYFASGLVSIKRWMSELEHELLAWSPNLKSGHDDIIDAMSMQRKFWVDMTDMAKLAKPAKPIDPMAGETIIKELTGRFAMASSYPFDGGNMDDRYLNEYVAQDSLRDRIRERLESRRADALIAL